MPVLHTYPTPTKHYIHTLPLNTYKTVTTYAIPTAHTENTTSRLRIGPTTGHILNDHVVDQ